MWVQIPLHQLIFFQFFSHSKYDSHQIWFFYLFLMWIYTTWKSFDYGRTIYTYSAKFCHHKTMTKTREVSRQTVQVYVEIWECQPSCETETGRLSSVQAINVCSMTKIYQRANENQNKVLKCKLQGLVPQSKRCLQTSLALSAPVAVSWARTLILRRDLNIHLRSM